MVWPHFKVFWFSRDNPTEHSERKKKKRQTKEEMIRQYQRVDRNGPAQLEQQKPGRDGKGLLRIHLWCPYYFPRLWDRKEKNKYTKGMIRSSYTAVQADFFFFEIQIPQEFARLLAL